VKVDYQVRCLDCEPRAPDDPPHRIRAVDGEAGFRTACTRDDFGGTGMYSIAVETNERQVNGNEGYALEIRQLALGAANAERGCRVSLREGPNTYEAKCGEDPPDASVPCQLIARGERGLLLGSLWCDGIPNSISGALRRSVVAPGSREPAELEVHGCPGL
jgi:hypothetical protein